MEYRRLGGSGLKVGALSFGSYVTFGDAVDLPMARQLLQKAYDAGVNFYDNAESYGHGDSERIMGQAIVDLGWERDTYLVSSKVFFGSAHSPRPTQRGLSRKHVVEACHHALRRLQVDYLDLYFCHRPDPETPIDETVRAMHDLIQQGKVLYWGTSEWPASDIREAFAVAEEHGLTPPTMEQPQYNMLHRDRVEVEYAHLYRRHGLGTTTWAPLRSGVLTGKYNKGGSGQGRLGLSGYAWLRDHLAGPAGQRVLGVIDELVKLADGLGTTMARLAIAWCLKNHNVSTVILGASSVEQLEENLGALDTLKLLDDGVMRQIESRLAPLRRPSFRLPALRRLAALRASLRPGGPRA